MSPRKAAKSSIQVDPFDLDEMAARCGRPRSLKDAQVIANLFTVRAKILAAMGTDEESLEMATRAAHD